MRVHRVYARIEELLRRRRSFAVAELVDGRGSMPNERGAILLVHPDGKTEFTIGGGVFEARVREDALKGFQKRTSQLKTYRLTPEETGMYCAGEARVWIRYLEPDPRLLIFGAGHVGQALARLSGTAEIFETWVIDDRAQFADPRRFPEGVRVVHTDGAYLEGVPPADPFTYVVIVTRCHETDLQLVDRYLRTPVRYLGMIGSERKWQRFRKELQKLGHSEEALQKVRSPIGLRIGGKTPEEIAVSILAEVVAAHHEAF